MSALTGTTGAGNAPGSLPRAMVPFVGFPAVLRSNGFAVSPDQTIGFIEAIGLLGPRSLTDIRRAGIAMLAIPRDRQPEYHTLFDAYFLGASLPAALPDGEDETEAHEAQGSETEIPQDPDPDEAGQQATGTERLAQRPLAGGDVDGALAALRRLGPSRLPRRRSFRYAPARSGAGLDMRRALREAVRRDGEILTLPRRTRKTRQRRIVLLIDVSGSMKERTDPALTLAHTLTRTAERCEVFTLGTRLTRITPALRLRRRDQALARASALIADMDGGTRIGAAVQAFLDVPRYAGFARGAAVTVLSDGLERGTPDALILATVRLGRIAWRLDWLTPLASADFAPRTEALGAILPWLDTLGDGSTTEAICTHLLSMASQR